MPAKYEAIRDKLVAGGMKLADAKTHAAKIYNAGRGDAAPVTGKSEGGTGKRVGVKHAKKK